MLGEGLTCCKSDPFPIFPISWCGSVQIRLSWWTFTVLKGEWRKSARVRVMNWEATQLLSFFQEVSKGSMNLLEFTWELPIHPAAELCLHNPEETTWFPFVEASTATHPFPTVYAAPWFLWSGRPPSTHSFALKLWTQSVNTLVETLFKLCGDWRAGRGATEVNKRRHPIPSSSVFEEPPLLLYCFWDSGVFQ